MSIDCLPGQLNKRCSSADVLLIHLIDDEWIFNYVAAFSPSSPSSSHLCWSVQSGLTRGGEGEVRGDQSTHWTRKFTIWKQTSQELQMLSLSLFIQGSLWMLRLLLSIVKNVINVSKVTSLWDCSLRVFFICQSFSFALYLSLSFSFCWSGHVSSFLWSNVSKVISLSVW